MRRRFEVGFKALGVLVALAREHAGGELGDFDDRGDLEDRRGLLRLAHVGPHAGPELGDGLGGRDGVANIGPHARAELGRLRRLGHEGERERQNQVDHAHSIAVAGKTTNESGQP